MNDFSNLGEQIKNTVQDAVDTMNFDHLNRNITDSVNSALNEVRNRLNLNDNSNQSIKDWKVSNGNQSNHQQNNYRYKQTNSTYKESGDSKSQYKGQSNAQAYTNMNANADMWEKRKQAAINRANQMRRNANSRTKTYTSQNGNWSVSKNAPAVINARRVPGRVSGALMKWTGYSFGTIFGLSTIVLAADTFFSTNGDLSAFIASGTFFALNLLLTIGGRNRTGRAKRFKKYISYIGTRKFCQLEALAANTGLSLKFIKKDLRKMLQLGFFPDGHLDDNCTCLILDQETYQQYLKTSQEYQRKQLEEEQELERQKAKDVDKKIDPELRKAINEGKSYIRQIKEANEAIPAIDISEKLSRLEQITSKIFAFVEEHPEQLSELRKFMEYYLPITLKLVNAYKDLDAQPVQGENISSSKKEIVQTLDTINYAFENLLDSLYQSTAMEVSSDISVLEALFAQDGLTKKDFDLK